MGLRCSHFGTPMHGHKVFITTGSSQRDKYLYDVKGAVSMKKELIKILDEIKSNNTEESVHNDVDEAKYDFIDVGWEDEFEDIYEAYEETGRDEAESQTLDNLIRNHGGSDLSTDDHCKILEELKNHYYLFF